MLGRVEARDWTGCGKPWRKSEGVYRQIDTVQDRRACDDALPQHKQIEIGTKTHVRKLDVSGYPLSYQRYRAIRRTFSGSAS